MRRLIKIDEEVARFAFEVHLRLNCPDWFVAFTNPTAGPWKRVIAPEASGHWGEVHRFEREELRPDLVVVSDAYRIVLIIEAKDDIGKLSTSTQASKSVEALDNIGRVLRSKGANAYWGARADYTVVCGLLWGGKSAASPAAVGALFAAYERHLRSVQGVADPILGIECTRGTNARLVACNATISSASQVSADVGTSDLINALALDRT